MSGSKRPFKSLETLFYVAVLLGVGYVIVFLLVKF